MIKFQRDQQNIQNTSAQMDRQGGERLASTATGTSTHAQQDMALPVVENGIIPHINQHILDSGIPRFEQWPTSSSDGTTLTHAHTSAVPSSSGDKVEVVAGSSSGNGSAASMLSFLSTQDVSMFLRQLHGRTFNTLNSTYVLPSDELEFERLDKQNAAFLIGFGGYYPAPEIVERILSPLPNDEPRRILDVGCGTGTWAISIAHQYPDVLVVGVDVAPVPLDSSMFPPNLSFEIDDINHGLSHYHNQFDLVRMCCVMSGIIDFAATLVDLENCLKPGGMLLVIDGDMPFAEDRKHIKMAKVEGDEDVNGVSEDGSWFKRMYWEAIATAKLSGSGVDDHELFDVGPWDDKLCDPATTVCGSLYLPVGPWAEGETPIETQLLQYTGVLIRQDFLNIHRAYHPVLLRHGMDQATLDEWSRRIDEELLTMTHRSWVRFRFFWTRRRESEGLPAPPLPSVDCLSSHQAVPLPVCTDKDNIVEPQAGYPSERPPMFPGIEFYHTREETLAKMGERNASLAELPTPAVEKAWRRKQACEAELNKTKRLN